MWTWLISQFLQSKNYIAFLEYIASLWDISQTRKCNAFPRLYFLGVVYINRYFKFLIFKHFFSSFSTLNFPSLPVYHLTNRNNIQNSRRKNRYVPSSYQKLVNISGQIKEWKIGLGFDNQYQNAVFLNYNKVQYNQLLFVKLLQKWAGLYHPSHIQVFSKSSLSVDYRLAFRDATCFYENH